MKGTAYLLQATLVSLWWIGLSISQDFFNAFQFPGISANAFNSFFLPDILLVSILSIVRAYKPVRELEFVILGGFAFGTLYCVNASIITQGGYLATVLMCLGLSYNLFLVFTDFAFRESKSNKAIINGFKTVIQIVCVWVITLVLFPWLILESFNQNLSFQSGIYFTTGLILLTTFSILGLVSAYAMVKNGKGTPLPIDQTTKLVLSGPYRYVRNPMAIAGVGQGIAIGVLFLSIPIFVYAILGGILWQFVVRPIEEEDLMKRFGTEYEDYIQSVPLWLPKLNQ